MKPDCRLQSLDTRQDLVVFGDSDWAGDPRTRKSTSGYVVQVLGTSVAFGSKTQASIATSSCEAELYALGTATAEALHVRHFLSEAGLSKKTPKVTLLTDSSSAKSLATRMGVGRRTKHIQLRYLFLQELVSSKEILLRKVPTADNLADLFTKYLPDRTLKELRTRVGLVGIPTFDLSSHD